MLSLQVVFLTSRQTACAGVTVAPRHCHGGVKHLHLSVGRDPSTQMTISFASQWSNRGVEAPIAGVHIGTSPDNVTERFVGEHEHPDKYESTFVRKQDGTYYSPFQHHITIDGLEPGTTYYYIVVLGERTKGIGALRNKDLRDHPSQHVMHENTVAENEIIHSEEEMNEENEDGSRRLQRHSLLRRLAPPPYDGHEHPCPEGYQVRSFTTAPRPGSVEAKSATFAIIGDLGQFEHSRETLEHMKKNAEGIDAVLLVGDIAYTDFDHRRWDTFFDFLDDCSIFDQVPLQVAIGNHGKCALGIPLNDNLVKTSTVGPVIAETGTNSMFFLLLYCFTSFL